MPPASAAWANSRARREEGAWAAENSAMANFMTDSISKTAGMIKLYQSRREIHVAYDPLVGVPMG